jgi:thiazole/oxazole-forming peptide maturase SagD family component
MAFRVASMNDPIPHSKMARWDNGEAVWVPASLVHLGFQATRPEFSWSMPDSNGLASGFDSVSTIWRATREVVERDAFTLRWTCRQVPKSIDLSAGEVPWGIQIRVRSLSSDGISVHLYLLTVDVPIPIVACVLEGTHFPTATVGLGGAPNVALAAEKAIDEAVSVRFALGHDTEVHLIGNRSEILNDPTGSSWILTFHDHALFYAIASNLKHLRQVFPRPEYAPVKTTFAEVSEVPWLPDPLDENELRRNLTVLDSFGMTVLVRELTTRDVAPKWLVYRVVIPEAMPLPQSMECRWLATPRLLNYAAACRVHPDAFNPFPHPFA